MSSPKAAVFRVLDAIPHRIRVLARPLYRATVARAKMRRYVAGARRSGSPVKVVFGGHWCEPPGWLVLTERDQDITTTLAFGDATVDVVFAEHVVEHIPLSDALAFFLEVRRILRPGGTFRMVCPTLEAMVDADLHGEDGRTYMDYTITNYFAHEEAMVRDLAGASLVRTAPHILFINFMFYDHGHRFIWTNDLMVAALQWTGFASASACEVGEGRAEENCLERRRRGIYLGGDPAEDRAPGTIFNCDSGIVEGIR